MRIDIRVPQAVLDQNEVKGKRAADTYAFRKPDRPLVVAAANLRYFQDRRGAPLGDFFQNPRTQIEQQLLNHQWACENLRDDRVIDTRAISVGPDLQAIRGAFFPVKVTWIEGGFPQAHPLLRDPQDVFQLCLPAPQENLFGRSLQWYQEMKRLVGEYEVTLNGQRLEIRVGVGVSGGPWTHANALVGDNLYLWVYEAPEAVHRLMELCTQAVINYERRCRELTGHNWPGVFLGCDSAEMLSPEMFREFVGPYQRRCYETFGKGRGLHMCGRIDHLLELLADELGLTELGGFGSVTDPVRLAAVMGGRVALSGGIDVNLLKKGPVEAIEEECLRYLRIFAPRGGYVLQDGNNVPPGTPVEHLHAMVRAAEKYAAERQWPQTRK